jgi:uncharacterized membrane-anchored protein YjiN (DUF445 family)
MKKIITENDIYKFCGDHNLNGDVFLFQYLLSSDDNFNARVEKVLSEYKIDLAEKDFYKVLDSLNTKLLSLNDEDNNSCVSKILTEFLEELGKIQ